MTPRLKSLELHGYKTFASRFLFEFPGDITAVVGPNGSGKSNIADSLRWVLGEQSYSLLRGRKTEDMIFAGSELRPRASMASATITFDNEDGWLPIDFSEVSITRRAYRDGQNEYLINGQRVRLKEIAELLGQSGLAERTYTIIGQGLVDAALSLKPEERRKFFEEAAGIGLYRSRREESLNRLENTRRNLERVLDILSELEPRLVSLEKQARRVQEYERIRADLRLLLRDWYGFHWHRSQIEVVHAREAYHAQEARLERARERQAEVEVHQREIRERLQMLRESLNQWHSRSAIFHDQWEKVSRNLAVMEERQRAFQEQMSSIQTDLGRLEEEQKSRQDRFDEINNEHNHLLAEQAEADIQAEQSRKNLDMRLAERAHVEQAVRNTRKLLVQNETDQVKKKAHQNELANRLETLIKNQKAIKKMIETESQLLLQMQSRLEKKEEQRLLAENKLRAAEFEAQEHRKFVSDLENHRRQVQEERAKLDADRAKLAAQLDVLVQAERSLSGLANGAKYLLQEARQGRVNGKLQALSGLLSAPAEYETAITVALGEFNDGVVFQDETDLDDVLDLFSGSGKGRAILFPKELAGMISELEVPDRDGVIGLASHFVQFSDELRYLMSVLLGQVLIVRDRSIARSLVDQIPPDARIVTLEGEVYYGSGVVVVGSETRSSTMGRPRRIQELRDKLSLLDQQIKETTSRLQEIDKDLHRLHESGRNLENTLQQSGKVFSQAGQEYQHAVLDLNQVQQRHEFQTRQLPGLDGQINQAEEELKQDQIDVDKISAIIKDLHDTLRDQNKALLDLPVEELQANVVHWNTASAVTARAVKDAGRRLNEHREAIQSGARQAEALKRRLNDVKDALSELDIENNSLHQQENEFTKEINSLRLQIEPAEQQLASVEKDYTELQAVMSVAQQAVTVAERHATQAQLELVRVREGLESLRRRIEDDFGIVALEGDPEVASQTPLPLEGMVEQLPVMTDLSPEIEENISRQRALLRRLGPINFEVEAEYRSVMERCEFLKSQVADLNKADIDLREVIKELDELMRREFRKTFDAVAAEFKQLFTRLFGGGSARLVLNDDEHPTESGIDIEARLPGRREQGLSLLSGGERSLTAVALIFSLLKVSPTPFCVLDEVDAMLDEANVGRFRDLLQELSGSTQFILVTHNRNTVHVADVIYGVTMGRDSASQVISLRLDEISDELVH